MYVFKLNKYLVLYSCTNNCVECLGFLTQSLSDKEEQLWVWEYEADDGKHDLYMDIDEEIRFRVIKETFVDTSPTSGMLYMNMHLTTTHLHRNQFKYKPPMYAFCISHSHLGQL